MMSLRRLLVARATLPDRARWQPTSSRLADRSQEGGVECRAAPEKSRVECRVEASEEARKLVRQGGGAGSSGEKAGRQPAQDRL